MNIFPKRKKEPEQRAAFEGDYTNPIYGTLSYGSLSAYTASKSMKIAAVYRAVDLIGNAIASMSLIPFEYRDNWRYINYKSSLYNLLTIAPNPTMGKFTFFKLLVSQVLMRGNAYVWVDRDKNGVVNNLVLLNPDTVTITKKGYELFYTDTETNMVYDSSQIIHVLNTTSNGLVGVSTITYASMTLDTAYNEKNHSNSFFKGGGLRGILKPIAGTMISQDKAVKAKAAWNAGLTNITEGNNGIIVLGDALEFQQVSISPRDAQVLESQAFSLLEISRFFGVPPALLYAENIKYNSAEQQSIDFINSTVLSWTERLENEFFRKLYLKSQWDMNDLKFDIQALYKTDLSSQADFYTKMQALGVFTVNDLRNKLNIEAYPITGGNEPFINVQTLPLTRVLNPVDNTNGSVDNKVAN